MIKALVWQLAVWLLSLLVLFVPAGTFAWSAGWIFFTLFFGFVLFLSLWLLKFNPSLLSERLTILRHDQQNADKEWLVAFYLLSLGWLAIMPMDAVRLHWLVMPTWVTSIGMVLLLCSLCGIFLTLRENPYASPVLRLQEDRGQTVVDTGVYSYMRHPLYTSAVLFYGAVPLIFNSGVGLLLSPIFVGMLIIRSVLEERMLQELPGYNIYMERVKYRFFPYIW
jgi:protein-S-isoprenylcysteine O-methyltransferase Ste14